MNRQRCPFEWKIWTGPGRAALKEYERLVRYWNHIRPAEIMREALLEAQIDGRKHSKVYARCKCRRAFASQIIYAEIGRETLVNRLIVSEEACTKCAPAWRRLIRRAKDCEENRRLISAINEEVKRGYQH